jgi:flagellar FliL protein
MAKDKEQEQAKDGSSNKKWILIGVGGVLLIVIIVGATLYFTGFFEDEAPNAEAASTEEVAPAEAIYQKLEPAFLVNYQNKDVRVMQVEVSLMARDQAVIDAVNQHAPVIRNNILLLLSGQDPETIKTTEGKVALQAAVLEAVNQVLTEHAVEKGVESVFFTSLVMQ